MVTGVFGCTVTAEHVNMSVRHTMINNVIVCLLCMAAGVVECTCKPSTSKVLIIAWTSPVALTSPGDVKSYNSHTGVQWQSGVVTASGNDSSHLICSYIKWTCSLTTTSPWLVHHCSWWQWGCGSHFEGSTSTVWGVPLPDSLGKGLYTQPMQADNFTACEVTKCVHHCIHWRKLC